MCCFQEFKINQKIPYKKFLQLPRHSGNDWFLQFPVIFTFQIFRRIWRPTTLPAWMESMRLTPTSWATVPSLPETTSPIPTSTCTRCSSPMTSWLLGFWTSTPSWLRSWDELRSCQPCLLISSLTSKWYFVVLPTWRFVRFFCSFLLLRYFGPQISYSMIEARWIIFQ